MHVFYRLLIFSKTTFFEKFFQEYQQSVKQFGSRSKLLQRLSADDTSTCADPEGVTRGPDPTPPPPLKNHKNIGFLSNSGPDPLKNYEATEPAFNVGLSSAPQPNAILMAFCWRADDGLLIVVFGHFHPSSTKKQPRCQSWTPLTNFSGSAHVVGKE